MIGSKKRGDYCWSIFTRNDQPSQEESAARDEAPACRPAKQATTGGSEPPPKPV
ncbi:MAG: hypothetical protein IT461_05175 [Planctomycetes bacterium]|nr:hypothetical protein [Planctomycetota bacterium]